MELRYYDIPQNEFLIALQNQNWQNKYQTESDLLHFHNLMEIGVCRRGHGTMRLEDDMVRYESGMISIIPANYPHNTIPDIGADNCWEYLFVDPEKIFAVVYADDILQQQKILENINRKAFLGREEDIPNMKNIICAIMSEMSRKQEFYRESTRGLGLALMMMIARMNSNVGNAPEGLRQKNGFDQVRPALEHIRDHYAMPMKIAEIASVCHMSESHFRRLFEENIGMTPVDYLNQVRKNYRLSEATDFDQQLKATWKELLKGEFAYFAFLKRNDLCEKELGIEAWQKLLPFPESEVGLGGAEQNPGS